MKEIIEFKNSPKIYEKKCPLKLLLIKLVYPGTMYIKKIWKPFIGQMIKFAREEKNSYDRFAISGSAKIPGKIGRAEVRHILWELNRYIWDTLDSGVIIWRKVLSDKYKPSPLFQGGLEIQIKVFVSWSKRRSREIQKRRSKA